MTNTRTEQYAYDSLNRLSTVDYGDGQTQGYTFDAMGNRLSESDSAAGATSYTYDAANRLTGAGGHTYQNDADGNRRSGGSGLSSPVNTWDSQNRLTNVTLGGGFELLSYTYGADGLRRSQTVTHEGPPPPGGGSNETTTVYAYDGQSLVREMGTVSGTFAPTATYLNGPRGPEYRRDDTQAEGTYVDPATGQTLPAGKTRWYVYDGLGSVVGEVDPSGNLTSSGTYDVYGAKRSGGTGTASSRQGFVGALGHVTDSETGLVYMRARYYDPATGRFISEDPAKDGTDWFLYCDNNPNNEADLSGEVPSVGTLAQLFLEYGTKIAVKVWAHQHGIDGDVAEAFRKEILRIYVKSAFCTLFASRIEAENRLLT